LTGAEEKSLGIGFILQQHPIDRDGLFRIGRVGEGSGDDAVARLGDGDGRWSVLRFQFLRGFQARRALGVGFFTWCLAPLPPRETRQILRAFTGRDTRISTDAFNVRPSEARVT